MHRMILNLAFVYVLSLFQGAISDAARNRHVQSVSLPPPLSSSVTESLGRYVIRGTRQISLEHIGPADDSTWQRLICKGGILGDAMRAKDANAATHILSEINNGKHEGSESKWTNYESLEQNDWKTSETGYGRIFKHQFSTLYHTLSFKGLNDMRQIHSAWGDSQHNLPKAERRKPEQSEMPHFTQLYDPLDGAIFALRNLSPQGAFLKADKEGYQAGKYHVPALRYWSDIVFLEWQRLAQDHITNINLIVRCGITDKITLAAARRVVEESGNQYGYFNEAKDSPIEDESAKALLGTPNGEGVAWLLLNHKSRLGCKEVKRVRVFADDTEETDLEMTVNFTPSIAFFIGNCEAS
ncbi:hypothetical protein NA57DRAFT_79945 [Rhizodiscina lignyota]|uniref:Uncharacterized protein n=1 Tax=Rhizodiscina lignyota TaxID=1504668 RepID=A0A9P4I453_9PEZI|nr:hypothetical protein NA57DRAFT_79945 [Rhizodiscina lignyota]